MGELFPQPALSQPAALRLADPGQGESPWALPCLPCLTKAAKQPGTEEEAGGREHCCLFELVKWLYVWLLDFFSQFYIQHVILVFLEWQ